MMSFIHKYVFNKSPWHKERRLDDGKLVIEDFNGAFVASIKAQLSHEIVGLKTDREIVDLWVARYNHDRESPHLEVIHGSINENGHVNIKLEWNDAFIKMLRDGGLQAESEDDLVRLYLASVTSNVDREFANEQTQEAQPKVEEQKVPTEVDIDKIISNMQPEVLKMFEKNIRSRAQRRRVVK